MAHNTALTIATDMDLDASMPLMSPNMPLHTIPEFPDEDEFEDISQGMTSPQQQLASTVSLQERRNILITRSEADDDDERNIKSNEQCLEDETQSMSWTYGDNTESTSPPSPNRWWSALSWRKWVWSWWDVAIVAVFEYGQGVWDVDVRDADAHVTDDGNDDFAEGDQSANPGVGWSVRKWQCDDDDRFWSK
ncbi:hypothetical protein BGX30_003410 [Mortierella sp. GBA39]|nr:hypothetical protein BGX30_003410 [Mortierella sp. GBA39]